MVYILGTSLEAYLETETETIILYLLPLTFAAVSLQLASVMSIKQRYSY